jgi:hypothetical protein
LRLLNEQLKNKMLMVENFTQTKDEAYDDDVLEMIVQVDEEFESQVRRNMQSLPTPTCGGVGTQEIIGLIGQRWTHRLTMCGADWY